MAEIASPVRWNLFATVLEDLLARRGRRLGQLDDQVGLHKETVRRLQRSLVAPTSFPMLSPNDLDAVMTAYTFSFDEKIRIRSAVLATAMEAKLMDRISPQRALEIATLILPLLEQELRERFEDDEDFMRVDEDDDESSDTILEQRCGLAIDACERGELALHLAATARDRLERGACLMQARAWFVLARDGIEALELTLRNEAWQFWHDRTTACLAHTDAILQL